MAGSGSRGLRGASVSSPSTTPSAFVFTDVTGAVPNLEYRSNTITVAGLAASSPITVTGGEVSITRAGVAGPFTSFPGRVINGDIITARAVTAAAWSGSAAVTVDIGGVSDTYTVTNSAAIYLPTVGTAPLFARGFMTVVSGYGGTLFRLRRKTSNQESDFSAIGSGDPRPDYAAIDAWNASFGNPEDLAVVTLYDQSGNGNDVTEGTAANQPNFNTSYRYAGHGPASFVVMPAPQGAARRLSNAVASMDRSAFSYFTGVSMRVFGGTCPLFTMANSSFNSTNGYLELEGNNGSINVNYHNGTTGTVFTGPGTRSNPACLGMVATTTGVKVYANETRLDVAGTLTSAAYTNHRLGFSIRANNNGNSNFFCDVGYAAALSNADGALVQAAINQICSFTLSYDLAYLISGDSLDRGQTVDWNINHSVLAVSFNAGFSNQRVEYANLGASGETMSTADGIKTTRFPPILNYFTGKLAASKVGVFENHSSNDIAAGTSAGSVSSGLGLIAKGIIDYVHTNWTGVKVALATMIDRTDASMSGSDITQMGLWNTLVRGGTLTQDGTFDRRSTPACSVSSDTAYFAGDLIHINNNGHAACARMEAASAAAMLGVNA